MPPSLRSLERRILATCRSDTEAAVARRLLRYAHKPCEYVREYLASGLTPRQAEILQKLDQPPYRVLARSANTQGKCVHPDDRIPLASGEMVEAAELAGQFFRVLTLVEGKPVATAAFATWDTPRPMYRVELESGEVLRRTGNHPVWAASAEFRNGRLPKLSGRGWRTCDQLRPGNVVAVPLARPHDGSDALTDDEAIFAAYIIGDGGCTATGITFTQTDGPQLAEFRAVCSRLRFDVVPTGNPIVYRLRRTDRTSPASPGALVRRLGLWKCHSRDKRIPAAVFSASRRQQSVFLSRLFATDGWASVAKGRRGAVEIGYCSVSEDLCRDVQELVSRFGVRTTLKDRGNCWCAQVQAARDVERFAAEIGIFGKETAVAAAVETAGTVRENRGGWRFDQPPAGCRWERVRAVDVLPDAPSVAITVPETQTFLTCVYEHNTYVAAAKCSHFYDTTRPSITLATAPTYVQVRDLLFRELRTIRPTAAGFLPKDTRLQDSPDHFVHGLTANKADAFQGRHGVSLGLVFDEATGVDPDFWRRGETMFESHGGHWWLASYNPNDSASPAYQAEESGTWHVVTLSALEHPNILAELRGEAPPIPAAVRLATVLRRMASECEETRHPDPAVDFEFPAGSGVFWHPTTPDFEAQIMGRWPVQPATALFSPFIVERAFQTHYDVNASMRIVGGCDVARFGDDKTTICFRVGPSVVLLETHSGVTTTWIAERLRACVRKLFSDFSLDPDASTNVPIFIDDTGGYGAGVIDQANGYNFIGINNAAESPDPRYPNNRSYLWCELAAVATANALDLSRLPLNDRLSIKQELTAARYELDARNRRRLWPKQKIKELIGRSPDRADALCLAYYGATSDA